MLCVCCEFREHYVCDVRSVSKSEQTENRRAWLDCRTIFWKNVSFEGKLLTGFKKQMRNSVYQDTQPVFHNKHSGRADES